MSKYILIEVADREFNHLAFDSLGEAKANLCSLYYDFCNSHDLKLDDDHDCWIDEENMSAYANWKWTNVDWKIIEV